MTMTAHTVTTELRNIAADVEQNGWDPETRSLIHMLSVGAWDALVTHLGEQLVVSWEQAPGRTHADVLALLRAAAAAVETGE